MEELKKRTTVYLKQPKDYEISGCVCGNEDIQWSEYEKHVWCEKCQIDFKPEYGGIFSSPIPDGLSRLFGVSFHRFNLETNQIEAFNSKRYYVEAWNILNFDFNSPKKIWLEKDEELFVALLNINNFEIMTTTQLKKQEYNLIICTFSHEREIKEWKLKVEVVGEKLKIKETEEFDFLKKFILNQKLRRNLPETNHKKINKV